MTPTSGRPATAARWIDEGSVGRLVCCTQRRRRRRRLADRPASSSAPLREREQRAAAEVVGYDDVRFLHQPDGALANDLALREQLVREIREFRPDAVLTIDPETIFHSDGGVNHIDHRLAGMAAVDAVYPAARNAMAFPWLARDGLEPWTVRRLYLSWSNHPTAWVDVTATIDRKLACPARAREPDPRSPTSLEERIREWAREEGAAIGVEAAEAHRVIVIEDDEDEGPQHAHEPETASAHRPGLTPGLGSVLREQRRPDAAPGVPDVGEVRGPGAERVDHPAQRQVVGLVRQPLVRGDRGLRVQLARLRLARPRPDPHPVEPRVAHGERQVARGRDPVVREPAQPVEAVAERRERPDDLAPLGVA